MTLKTIRTCSEVANAAYSKQHKTQDNFAGQDDLSDKLTDTNIRDVAMQLSVNTVYSFIDNNVKFVAKSTTLSSDASM